MRLIISFFVFITSVTALAVEVVGSPKSTPLNTKTKIQCIEEADLKAYDHGILQAQFAALAIVDGNVEMTLTFQKNFCQKSQAGVIDFVKAGLFENYSYSYMQNILVEPLQFAITVYNQSTYVEYGGIALKADQPSSELTVSIPLDKILSAQEMSSITNNGQKIEKKIGISVNQLSNYTPDGDKTIQANQFYHLKTSLLFF